MQNPPTPVEGDEAPIPTETVSDPNMNRTVPLRRKAAKRTLPFDLTAEELDLVSPTPPQDEDIPGRKKRRLEEPLPTTTYQPAKKTVSADVSVGLSPPATADSDDANADAVTDTQPNAVGSNRTTARLWTTDEDAQLTSAVANTSKKKWGNEYKTDWDAVAALVPNRTKRLCINRWKEVLDPSIGRASGRAGKWTAAEGCSANARC
jgi:hypothetical protein